MELNFHINNDTVNQMSWEEFEAFERAQDGDLKLYQLRPVLARFMVDEKMKPVPHKQAMTALAKIPLEKVQETIEVFVDAIREGVIPKANGNSLNLPSEAASADSEFPDGVQS